MRYYFIILSLFVTFLPHPAGTTWGPYGRIQTGGVVTAAIDSPVAGQAVQGAVVIRGSTAVEQFQYYEIDTMPTANSTQSWSMIQQSSIPIQDGTLAIWETNSITDGDYNLRLVIFKIDGSRSEISVVGLRVRNYTSLDRSTLTPTVMYVTLGPGTPTSTPTPSDTLSPSITPLPSTPTPLPVNPSEVTASQVMSTFGTGVALSVALLALLGAYVGLRAFQNGRK